MIEVINGAQGSPEWHQHRAKSFNASEAAAMLGMSPYMTRSELLKQKATGIVPEVDSPTKRRFDKGHEYEECAREWAQESVCEELYPVVLAREVDGIVLSASFDGLTMLYDTAWEHKTLNARLRESLGSGEIPEEYMPQLEQQLMVSGASRVLFMASSGVEESSLSAWYESNPALRAKIIAGWKQFAEDLANYQHAPDAPEVVAEPVSALPAITYQLNGLALTSNLDLFRQHAEAAIEKSKSPLVTDQDFADREALCKAFAEAEKKLHLVREQVVGEIHDVDAFCRGLAEIGEHMRQARLSGEKQVKTRKDEIRLEIRDKALNAFMEHCSQLNLRLGSVTLPDIPDGFAAAMKNKRTIATLQDAVDTELARLKIEANEWAEKIMTNLDTLREIATGYEALFRDQQYLVQQDPEMVRLVAQQRVDEFKAEQERKLEAERERIRAEEERKAREEAERAAEAERRRIQSEENKARLEKAALVKREQDEQAKAFDALNSPEERAKHSDIPPAQTITASIPSARPSEREIVEALAHAFSVSSDVALAWILDFSTEELEA